MPSEAVRTLFLAIPGTQDTRELDLEEVRNGVARGEIPLDNWAWSPQRNEWLPLAQLPEFAVAAAPAPIQVEPVKVQPVKVAVATPAVAVKMPAQARTTSATGGTGHAATYYSKPMEEHHEFPVFKILFFVLGLVIAALVGVNYFMVDKTFRENLAKTPFAGVQAHAHLGAFVQPGVLLIHIFPSNQVTSDNFADLLTAMTRSAPREGVPGHEFQTISITPAWLGQYAIPVEDWTGFADMSGYTPEEKEDYVLSHLELIDGEPVYKPAKNESAAKQKAREDEVWNDLVAKFHAS